MASTRWNTPTVGIRKNIPDNSFAGARFLAGAPRRRQFVYSNSRTRFSPRRGSRAASGSLPSYEAPCSLNQNRSILLGSERFRRVRQPIVRGMEELVDSTICQIVGTLCREGSNPSAKNSLLGEFSVAGFKKSIPNLCGRLSASDSSKSWVSLLNE